MHTASVGPPRGQDERKTQVSRSTDWLQLTASN